MPNSSADEQRIDAIRMLSIDAVQKANSGHPGMPLGAAAVAFTIWTRHLRHNPQDPKWFDRDRFVLSAGHGSMLLYSLLYLTGYLSKGDLEAFRQLHSLTPGHPESHITLGVEVTTGPLGQGAANAVGLAVAEAHLAATFNRDRKIVDHYTYVMTGDGDLMEGVSAEAGSLAGHLKLGKLIVFYDDNKVSLAGATDVSFTEDVLARYEAYGWHVQHIGEERSSDVAAIDEAITAAKNVADRPSIIGVRSHIGLGSPRQDLYLAHGEPLGADGVTKTKEHFGWPNEPSFYVPDDVLAWYRDGAKRGADLQREWTAAYAAWKAANAEAASEFERMVAGRLPQRLPWPVFTAENGNIATRDAGGAAMNAIAGDLPELIGGSADLDPSTKTYLKGFGDFAPAAYAGRNIHFGVREHAMGAIANGIAAHGSLLPFTATFFNFLDYMKPAVRLAALSELRVVNVFTHDSVFLGEDGPTHQPIEQLAMLRATPNVNVIRPADALETVAAWQVAVHTMEGPTAIVLTRQKVPFLGQRVADVARGAYVLRDADGRADLILLATGSEVSLAVDAAKLLESTGTKVRVVSMPCWELFERQDESYRDSVLPPDVRARVSIEAGATLGWHRWIGDCGVAIGIDHYGASAPAGAIAEAFGFTPQRVADVAAGLLAKI